MGQPSLNELHEVLRLDPARCTAVYLESRNQPLSSEYESRAFGCGLSQAGHLHPPQDQRRPGPPRHPPDRVRPGTAHRRAEHHPRPPTRRPPSHHLHPQPRPNLNSGPATTSGGLSPVSVCPASASGSMLTGSSCQSDRSLMPRVGPCPGVVPRPAVGSRVHETGPAQASTRRSGATD